MIEGSENPNAMRGIETYENPGGRPPEGMCQVGVLPVLERPSSPADLEDQRVAKEGRNVDGISAGFRDTGEAKDLEAGYEEVLPTIGKLNAGTEEPGLNDSRHGKLPTSYAVVAAKRSCADDGQCEEE
ncbi:hypothetical protein V6N13_043049 [Hibiscus sabdariffa]